MTPLRVVAVSPRQVCIIFLIIQRPVVNYSLYIFILNYMLNHVYFVLFLNYYLILSLL